MLVTELPVAVESFEALSPPDSGSGGLRRQAISTAVDLKRFFSVEKSEESERSSIE